MAKLKALPLSVDGEDRHSGSPPPRSVAVVGLGYVGLPTAIALCGRGISVIGVDVSEDRLDAVRVGDVDLLGPERAELSAALATRDLRLTAASAAIAAAEAVVICVPTPIDRHQLPELGPLRRACADVVRHAREGQLILLTSTSYVGATRQLLIEPLTERGFTVGAEVCVAVSPERIDPGVDNHRQRETPRVVGADTTRCADRAGALLGGLTDRVYAVSSPEVAELAKLYENLYRAVNLALANEIAEICGVLRLDPVEVTAAAATKPYGFLGCLPGPGVGGHCIPCDPHYLLWQLRSEATQAPLIELAMGAIAHRPHRVAARVSEVLAESGRALTAARVLVVGVSYKPGVRDLRGSSAVEIIADLVRRGASVRYYDPLVPWLALPGGEVVTGESRPCSTEWDLVLIHTLHPGIDYDWAVDAPTILDATYRFEAAKHRQVV